MRPVKRLKLLRDPNLLHDRGVRNGKKLKGQKLFIPMKDKTIKVTVSDFIFFDNKNERLNA